MNPRLLTYKETVECSHNPVLELRIEGIKEAQDTKSVKAIVGWMEAHECIPEDHDVTYEGINKIQKHHPDCQLCFWEALKLGVKL